MSISSSRSTKRSASSRPTPSTNRTTPYDPNYKLKLVDAGILPAGHDAQDEEPSLPVNYADIMAKLNEERSSLSPSRFTERDFRNFQRNTFLATEATIMDKAMPAIEGDNSSYYTNHGGVYNRARPFSEDIAYASPDAYDGVPPRQIHPRVRSDLDSLIMPSNDTSRPAAPNFSLEAKSNKGRADVAVLQAAHYGAHGARAMHELQNYGADNAMYDGKAYSFSSTLHNGQLMLCSTHPVAPTAPGAAPAYHMTQLDSYALTGNKESFRKGAAAYRNTRDMASTMRDSFVEQANQKAQLMAPTAPDSATSRAGTMHTSRKTEVLVPATDPESSPDELALDYEVRKRMRPAKVTDDRDSMSFTTTDTTTVTMIPQSADHQWRPAVVDGGERRESTTRSLHSSSQNNSRRSRVRDENQMSFTSTDTVVLSQAAPHPRTRPATERVQQRLQRTPQSPAAFAPRQVEAKRTREDGVPGRKFTMRRRSVFVPDTEWKEAKRSGRRALVSEEWDVWCFAD